jgi:hypothetical protein
VPPRRRDGGGELLALISGQPQHRGPPLQRPPPRPHRPALLQILQRAKADLGPAGQLPLR